LGKYSQITDKLPRILGTEAPYQQKVDETKDVILNAPALTADDEARSYQLIEEGLTQMAQAGARIEFALLAVSGGRRHGSVFAKMYKAVRQAKTTHEEEVEKRINLLQIAIEQLTVDQFEAEGTTTIKLADGGSVRVQYEPHATVQDRELYRRWCLSEQLDTQMMLPWMTTNAILKERLLSGLDTMPGVVANSKAKTVYTKG
jgi:hypothetical protein